jgi:hypothetical protein
MSASADELTHQDRELAALDRRGDEIELQAQERESALGFRLGEMYELREQMASRGAALAEIDRSIAELEARVAAVDAERLRGLGQVRERSVALTAERNQLGEKLDAACDALDQLLRRPLRDTGPI